MITRYFICLQGYQPCRERRAGNGASELLTKISAIRGNPLDFYFVWSSLSNNPIKTVQWVYSDRQRSPFVAVEIPINKIIGRGTRFSVGEHHNSPNCRINSWIDKDALFNWSYSLILALTSTIEMLICSIFLLKEKKKTYLIIKHPYDTFLTFQQITVKYLICKVCYKRNAFSLYVLKKNVFKIKFAVEGKGFKR